MFRVLCDSTSTRKDRVLSFCVDLSPNVSKFPIDDVVCSLVVISLNGRSRLSNAVVVVFPRLRAKIGNAGTQVSRRGFASTVVVEISVSLIFPNFVFLYTLQAMIFVRTMLGVAHIERMGMGTDVSNIITTVTRFDIKLILCASKRVVKETWTKD